MEFPSIFSVPPLHGIGASRVTLTVAFVQQLYSNTISCLRARSCWRGVATSEEGELLRQRFAKTREIRVGMDDGAGRVVSEEALAAQYDISQIVREFRFYRPKTGTQMHGWWKRLQSAKGRAGGVELPDQSYDDIMEEGLAMINAQTELEDICANFRRDVPRTDAERRLRWARLQSAKRRAGGIGFPHRSYDDQMVVSALAVAGGAVVQAEQQEPSPLPRATGADSPPTLPPATVQLLLHDSELELTVSGVAGRSFILAT